ncbi:MAG TPA: type II toxin-antitoxin system HicB family antitoxin [Parachlamydiaceae bacterium]|nr:type II toxin-antitoxin system HicB family antitoxin [Parachlamydiaceae bacterium]
MMKIPEYPFTIRELSLDDGSGFLIEFPDLPGCMSDGETVEEAMANGVDAVQCWIDAAKAKGREIPDSCDVESQSGKWVQRVPKTLHARLTRQAKREHVSLNTLVVSILSESLGLKSKHHH